MSVRGDDCGFAEDVGAHLLGALDEAEERAFGEHLAGCAACRGELERLRQAAEALPRSVSPVRPPDSLKAALMEVVQREAEERTGARPGRRAIARARRALRTLAPVPARMRPIAAWVSAAFLLAVGIASGYGVSSILSDDDAPNRLTATVDAVRLPAASASLLVPKDDRDGAILRVNGMPTLPVDRVYQVWLERDGEVVSQSIFNVGDDGQGAAAVPGDLSGADAVLVTRERAGGAPAPGEAPILRVSL